MPLVKCSECQLPVSTAAATCPNCGAPVKPKSSPVPVVVALIVIGLVAAVVVFASIQVQQTQRAKENLDHAIRDADRTIAVYSRIYSTPKPSDAIKRERDHATEPLSATSPSAPPRPPPQAQTYRTAVLKRPTTFQLPSGNVTLPRGSQVEFVSRDELEVRVRYRGHQQSIPVSDVDLR
jgi:type II secretory pathway pseudopilin PulG